MNATDQKTPNDRKRESLKPLVRGAYDLQSIRIMMGNRIVMNWKAKAGKAPAETDKDGLPAEDIKYLKMLKEHYRKIASGIAAEPKPPVSRKRAAEVQTTKDRERVARAKQPPDEAKHAEGRETPIYSERLPSRKAFVGDEIISTYTEMVLLAQYINIEAEEAKHFRQLTSVLEDFPIYTYFLEPTAGCGPAMSGVIISEIDIARARYPSSLWAYAGLDVHTYTNGTGETVSEGRSRKAHHLIDRTYINAAGEEAVRKSITFNPLLKTKLLGVLGPSFLKCGNETYRKLYDDYKHRLESDPGRAGWSKGRRHNAAIRYMVKMFLRDLYNAWRALEGLPIAPTYAEAKLGMKHAGRLQTPRTTKRAIITKPPKVTKRVAKGKKPGDRKRAVESKKPDVIKRAVQVKKPIADKRAGIPETPSRIERAEQSKTPLAAQRATEIKAPVIR